MGMKTPHSWLGKRITRWFRLSGSARAGELGFLVLASALLGTLAGGTVLGQTASPSTASTSKSPVSLPHLYWHFLVYQNHLDRVATQREEAGKDGSWLRNYYQQELGFNDTEFQAVRQSAQNLEAQLKQIDARVQVVVQQVRARQPRTLTSPDQLPPVPPELRELSKKRESVIESEVANLKNALPPESAAKLDTFLQTVFAPKVKVQLVGPPRPHDPTKHPIPPFPTEVQP